MRLEDLPFPDVLDIAWSYIVSQGGGEFRVREALRGWIRTGTVSIDDSDTTGPVEQSERPTEPARGRVKLAEGFLVSPDQIEAFKEMGGTMVRKKPRRRPAPTPELIEPLP